jgi:hypothetical protein
MVVNCHVINGDWIIYKQYVKELLIRRQEELVYAIYVLYSPL